MFEREVHRRVAKMLEALDAQLLRECRAAFAGGTRLAMRLGEFRASRDLDLLVSDRNGYRELLCWLPSPSGRITPPRGSRGATRREPAWQRPCSHHGRLRVTLEQVSVGPAPDAVARC